MSEENESEVAPLHGFRGDVIVGPPLIRPMGLSLAISREAGGRGGSIARRVGEELGWQCFDADAFEFLIQDDSARNDLLSGLPDSAKEWANVTLAGLTQNQPLELDADVVEVVRLMLTLAARGEVVLVGRGAGFVLPPATTLHVRVVSSREQRMAYISEWLRMTPDEALAELEARDHNRLRFLKALGVQDPYDPTLFDLMINSDRLGDEVAAGLIVQAVRARMDLEATRQGE